MNNKFLDFRNKYDTFIYDRFDIVDNIDIFEITFYFSIPGLCDFSPKLFIDKKHINCNIDSEFFNYLVFNIGMVELISYVKCTCSPNIVVNCGYLDDYQIGWFKKLYYNGLGEFLYRNSIDISIDDLFNITCCDKKYNFSVDYKGSGNLIPVGGGKDSNVTLSLLDGMDNTCFIINPKGANIECAKVAGYSDNTFIVKRIIDRKIVDLNNEGYLNGHTPFSAIVAFVSYLCAYLSGKKYIVLSNEDSANESTVIGTSVNHQYSKTFEFENDFNNYTRKYYGIDIKYFSLLRPLTEFQIGMLFSKLDKFHKVFKSCNIGSKGDTWDWCCKCPKCLFVFIILSPFLYKDKLIDIFGRDLYEDSSLLNTFKELLGYSETKPFECVGTYGEVRFAVSLLIDKLGDDLPYLLRYYKDNYPLSLDTDYRLHYNYNNNLDSSFELIVKDAISNV
jgi:hypothetical protein